MEIVHAQGRTIINRAIFRRSGCRKYRDLIGFEAGTSGFTKAGAIGMMLGREVGGSVLKKWQQQQPQRPRQKGRKNSQYAGKARTWPAKSFAASFAPRAETAVNATLRRQGVMVQKVRKQKEARGGR